MSRMEMIDRIVILSGLWLITFSGLCSAEPSTSFSQAETSQCILQFGEEIQVRQALTPLEPLKSEGPADEEIRNSEEATPPEPSQSEEPVDHLADPLEPINRAFFHFNDKFYFWVLKPVASGYKAIIPEDGRVGVRNFFSNLATPIRLVNCLLQAKFKGAGNEAVRFLLNSTLGLAGLLDPAKKEFNIEKQDEDFGQTLGFWGIGPTFYIDWPLLGPSNLRDTVGFVGDLFFDPRTYIFTRPIFYAVRPVELVNDTSLRIGEYEDLKKAAIDPYVALKDATHQYRQNKIRKK
jgi:phospholipid-binding lipoprotein MlaA